jgi:hypothetical protein
VALDASLAGDVEQPPMPSTVFTLKRTMEL